MSIKKILVSTAAAFSLTACVADSDVNVPVLQGPPVTEVETPYKPLLACLAGLMVEKNVALATVAVGNIADRTGRTKYNENETINVTEGAGDMVSSAIMDTGIAHLVERLDTRIMQFEQAQAMKKILGDGKATEMRAKDGTAMLVPYRAIAQGSLVGSAYHVQGGITALDFGVSSAQASARIAGIGPGVRQARGIVAIDLRVIETATGRVVAAKGLNKQIVVNEAEAGITRFWGTTFLNIGASAQQTTALNLMLRGMLQLGLFEVMSQTYAIDSSSCRDQPTQLPAIQGAAT